MTRFMKKEFDALEAFRKEMSKYGLEVDNGTSGSYSNDMKTFHLSLRTKLIPAKGQKPLMKHLKQNGYFVNTFFSLDIKTVMSSVQ